MRKLKWYAGNQLIPDDAIFIRYELVPRSHDSYSYYRYLFLVCEQEEQST